MANLHKKFSKIYDQYIEKIYRFIFLKVNSQEIAQDLCSETFLRGWKAFKNQPQPIFNGLGCPALEQGRWQKSTTAHFQRAGLSRPRTRAVAKINHSPFSKGWVAPPSNKGGGKNQKEIKNVSAFLYRIARNLVTDYYREKGKAQIVSAEYVQVNDPNQNLEEKAMLASDIGTIRVAITSLKDEYQDVIIWHYLDDLPISEVANLLDRTEGATRVLLHRALTALRQKINSP